MSERARERERERETELALVRPDDQVPSCSSCRGRATPWLARRTSRRSRIFTTKCQRTAPIGCETAWPRPRFMRLAVFCWLAGSWASRMKSNTSSTSARSICPKTCVCAGESWPTLEGHSRALSGMCWVLATVSELSAVRYFFRQHFIQAVRLVHLSLREAWLCPGDVMSAWYGIRPLCGDPNAKDQSSASRDHVDAWAQRLCSSWVWLRLASQYLQRRRACAARSPTIPPMASPLCPAGSGQRGGKWRRMVSSRSLNATLSSRRRRMVS